MKFLKYFFLVGFPNQLIRTLTILFFISSIQAAETPSLDDFKDQLRRRADTILPSFQTEEPNVWNMEKLLFTHILMYEKTKDHFFLDEMVRLTDALFENRDDRRKRSDQLRNKILPAWSTTAYSDSDSKKRTAYVVHTGILTAPIAQFIRIIFKNPQLKELYGEKAKSYLTQVIESVRIFDSEWNKEGYYFWPKGMGKIKKSLTDKEKTPLPFNQMLALGNTLIYLRHVAPTRKKREEFKNKASLMAQFFKKHLEKIDLDNRYVWKYAVNGPIEDSSHAGLDIQFVTLAFKEVLVFKESNLEKFVNTFKRITKKAFPTQTTTISSHVDGSNKNTTENFDNACQRWLTLQFADPYIKKTCAEIAKTKKNLPPLWQAQIWEE